jgi:hypothetical protein
MLKVLRIIVLSLPVLWTNCLSQSVKIQQVLVPGASVVTNGTITLSQTVGELMVMTIGDSYYILTQGFQQPMIDIREGDDDFKGVKVYPNPASDFVTVEIVGDDPKTFRIEFLDLTGRIFISAKKSFGHDYIYREQYNVKELVSGFYMVRIMSDDGLFCRTFRIQKI